MTAATQHQQLESFYEDPSLRQPVTMQQPETAKNVTVYLNGDKYNPGKRLVVNRKHVQNFDGFLTMVTNGLKPSFGAVRHIYTPKYGHKVTELKDINTGMAVVAGGSERFRKLAYQEIAPKKPHQQRLRPDQEIRPVHHSKMTVAARWKEVGKGPCNIYVYGNGDINGAAVRLLLVPRILRNWDMVLQEVTEKIAFRTGQACRRLYTLEGELVSGSDQLENGRYYISVGNEKFKRLPYGERAQHMALVASTRKAQHRLPPLQRRGHTNANQQVDSTYSEKYAARRQLEDRGYQSHPPTGGKPSSYRRLRPIRVDAGPAANEPASVFRGKPMKVKRSSATGKLTQVEHEEDVFRAKRRGVVAEEVADDDETKVDLPIDQMPATVVEEEEYPISSRRKDSEVNDGNYHETSTEPKSTYAPRIEEDDSDLTAPSKTPTSARRYEPQTTARSEPSEQKPNSHQPSRDSTSPAKQVDGDEKIKNKAAIAIQSSYRGYRVRSTLKSQRKENSSNPEPINTTADVVDAVKSTIEEERQPTPAPVMQSPSPRGDSASPPQEQTLEASHEFNPAIKESSSPESKELVTEDRPEDTTERQPSPEEVATGQPVLDPTIDEHANSRSSKSPAVDVVAEETELRETTPTAVEKSHPDKRSPHPDTPIDGTHSPNKVSNGDQIDTTRSEEAAGLPERDDGDGTDDEKHRNNPPTPDNGTEPAEAPELPREPEEKSPRSGQLTSDNVPATIADAPGTSVDTPGTPVDAPAAPDDAPATPTIRDGAEEIAPGEHRLEDENAK